MYISCDFIFEMIDEWLLQTVTNSAKSYANTAYEGLKSSGHSDETSFVATELVCIYNALISYIQHIISMIIIMKFLSFGIAIAIGFKILAINIKVSKLLTVS